MDGARAERLLGHAERCPATSTPVLIEGETSPVTDTPSLRHHVLRIAARGPMLQFYQTTLGSQLVHTTPNGTSGHERYRLKIADRRSESVCLEFWYSPVQQPSERSFERTDNYWKIGLTMADLDAIRAELMAKGIEVSEPRQFRDIGYLCHLTNPDG